MPEPITEVWVIRCPALKDKVYLSGAYAESERDRLEAGGWQPTLDRLPLATPEMVECVNAVRQFGALVAEVNAMKLQGEDLSGRYDLADKRTAAHGRLLLAAQRLAAIDATLKTGGRER